MESSLYPTLNTENVLWDGAPTVKTEAGPSTSVVRCGERPSLRMTVLIWRSRFPWFQNRDQGHPSSVAGIKDLRGQRGQRAGEDMHAAADPGG